MTVRILKVSRTDVRVEDVPMTFPVYTQERHSTDEYQDTTFHAHRADGTTLSLRQWETRDNGRHISYSVQNTDDQRLVDGCYGGTIAESDFISWANRVARLWREFA